MNKPKIQPLGDMIQIEMEQASLGALDTSSMKTGVEWGIIKGIGPEVQNKSLKVGDRIFCKSWGVDVISYENEDHYFVSEARKAIVATVK